MKWSELISPQAKEFNMRATERVYRERQEGKEIYPPDDLIYRAIQLTPPDAVKVCIVGQDPYHTPGAANGLAFSTNPDCPIQPSLRNIFKELHDDIGCEIPSNGDLTAWAERGVLLLNTTLTVYAHQPNSHASWGWNEYTTDILKAATKLPQPVVFMLWGASAQDKLKDLISCAMVYEGNNIVRENLIKKAYILSSHPSPFSASRTCRGTPAFLGSKPFSTANRLLIEMGGEPVDWNLV